MDRSEICDRFLDALPYSPYPFQEEALLAWFAADRGVLICAPTGMGKTLIAEAAIFEALHSGKRMYYTTPLIALTDQKFREFQDKAEAWGFRRDDVGLITGNRKVNPDARVQVVVAEILLNHLLEDGTLDSTSARPMDSADEPLPYGRGSVPSATVQQDMSALRGGHATHFSHGTHSGLGTHPGHGNHSSHATDVTDSTDSSRAGEAAQSTPKGRLSDVESVVMDEFHYFNDLERGIVWELSLVLLPRHVRLMLLSATIGNPVEFIRWLADEHGRSLQLIKSEERKVPLEFEWVGDKLLTEHLPLMVSKDDTENRTPALVFCFNRDECWEVAERLKGVKLIDPATRAQIEGLIDRPDFAEGVGPKLWQMLICGVGVHHAGVLPKHKEIVERLFLSKLIPFVVCTETLAAGINLPARSVVITTLLKGKPGERKLIAPAIAHQMFGRAGRPQFDAKGYVYAIAHEDDARIAKWKKKFEQIDPNSKDPGVMRMRKELERKRPTRRKTEQYWMEGQFRTLIQAGPAKLASRSMIPYRVLIYLLLKRGSLADARRFLTKRFDKPEHLQKFQEQLDHMLANLGKFEYLARSEDGQEVTLSERINELFTFRSIDPLYAMFLSKLLVRASFDEKLQALESVLGVPPAIEKQVRLPEDLPPGPLRANVLEPELIQMGLMSARPKAVGECDDEFEEENEGAMGEEEQRPLTFPEMLKALFDAKLASPEPILVQPKWVAGGIVEADRDFYKYVRNRNLVKNEGLILRHLLRLVILAGEFLARSDGDPEYAQIGDLATQVCQKVDPRYTDRFLAAEEEARKLLV